MSQSPAVSASLTYTCQVSLYKTDGKESPQVCMVVYVGGSMCICLYVYGVHLVRTSVSTYRG